VAKLRINIQFKLFFLIAIMIIGFVAITVVSLTIASGTIENLQGNQLKAIKETKARQIENYLSTIQNQITVIAQDINTVQAMKDFAGAYQALNEREFTNEDLREYTSSIESYLSDEFFTRLPLIVQLSTLETATYLPQDDGAKLLQYNFISNNPNPVGQKDELVTVNETDEYFEFHTKYHPGFRNFLDAFGFYDIFLIEPENGVIVYSVFKEADYATSLVDGPYSDTNIATVFTRGKELSESSSFVMEDYKNYPPSYYAPAAFISAPIYEGSTLLGVLVFQFSSDEIDSIMTGQQQWEKEGLGETGEAFLAGSDGLLRSNIRSYIEDPDQVIEFFKNNNQTNISTSLENINSSIMTLEVTNTEFLNALESQLVRTENIIGVPVLSSFRKLQIDQFDWTIFAEISEEEAFASLVNLRFLTVIISLILILVLTVVAIILAQSISKPLKVTTAILLDIAEGDGDLTKRISLKRRDEIGQLSSYFDEFITKLQNIVNKTKDTIGNAAHISADLSSSSEQTGASISEIGQTLSEITDEVLNLDSNILESTTAVEQIQSNISNLANEIDKQNDIVANSSTATEEIVASIHSVSENVKIKKTMAKQLVSNTNEGASKVERTTELITLVQHASDQILEAVKIIKGISNQTNLLAMNAAIEAAHAGEAGKGFSVVADEIRKLSESTQENTVVISDIIQDSTDKINQAMDSATDSAAAFQLILKEVKDFSDTFDEISFTMEELSTGSNQILESVENLSSISSIVGQGSEEMKHGSQEIVQSMVMVKDVSNKVRDSIQRINESLEEIRAASIHLTKLGHENKEYLNEISSQMGSFKSK
jgi:methyl-accepting chemotaxis protein